MWMWTCGNILSTRCCKHPADILQTPQHPNILVNTDHAPCGSATERFTTTPRYQTAPAPVPDPAQADSAYAARQRGDSSPVRSAGTACTPAAGPADTGSADAGAESGRAETGHVEAAAAEHENSAPASASASAATAPFAAQTPADSPPSSCNRPTCAAADWRTPCRSSGSGRMRFPRRARGGRPGWRSVVPLSLTPINGMWHGRDSQRCPRSYSRPQGTSASRGTPPSRRRQARPARPARAPSAA